MAPRWIPFGAALLAASPQNGDAACAGAFQQCGGGTAIADYMGPTCCEDGYVCKQNSFFPGNQYYKGFWECTPVDSPWAQWAGNFMASPPEQRPQLQQQPQQQRRSTEPVAAEEKVVAAAVPEQRVQQLGKTTQVQAEASTELLVVPTAEAEKQLPQEEATASQVLQLSTVDEPEDQWRTALLLAPFGVVALAGLGAIGLRNGRREDPRADVLQGGYLTLESDEVYA